MKQRVKIVIRGAVQGVGFRPFVYRLAKELNIKGWIVNSSQGVFIEAEADENVLNDLLFRLVSDKPKNSFIQSFEHSYLDVHGYDIFEIMESHEKGGKTALVLPDISTCPDCLQEIFDPSNRRYLYPFTNCTNCGPRFTIIKDLPYDRAKTTMAEFVMCPDCLAEYTDPSNRRFHAEPTACPVCGPQVELWDQHGRKLLEKHDAIHAAAKYILEGKIVALKGIGGYQLICDAGSDEAVRLLRTRKKRSEKPFALMMAGIESIKKECEVSPAEERSLLSVEAPIVLLKRRKGITSTISNETAAGNPYCGIMLPYSPLHHILMKELSIPIIATSGNISEEPICINETQALEKLKSIADYFLVHNREILRHVDDSITRISAGREMLLRRARGYAPLPVVIEGLNKTVLAAGAHLKNTIALNKGSNVFISQHIGDLENIESINAFKSVINDLETFYELSPQMVVHDMHPDYTSTQYAKSLGIESQSVQHHYAHVLSCIADSNIEGDVLGVSWDGTGFGSDGMIWGSEFIVPKGKDFLRAAHLKPFKLPGGEKSIHEVWRIGFALLYDIYGGSEFGLTGHNFKVSETEIIRKMLDKNINSPVTTSMGRLFDGVSAILGIRRHASFEAQAAMELEFATDEVITNDYLEYKIDAGENNSHVINWHPLLIDIVNKLNSGVDKNILAAMFHNTLSEIITDIAKRVGIEKVLLTGGCFQNKYLLEGSIRKLKNSGFKVYWHQRVPSNDGGISLGQMKYSAFLI